eukprot:COSAG04_NODE_3785_length_2534_cov_1.593429_3_plen_318_part_01
MLRTLRLARPAARLATPPAARLARAAHRPFPRRTLSTAVVGGGVACVGAATTAFAFDFTAPPVLCEGESGVAPRSCVAATVLGAAALAWWSWRAPALSAPQAALGKQLCDAAKKGDAAAIERLVGEGASPDAKRADGLPAVVVAALLGHTAAVEALLRLGADPNATDKYGSTALMAAGSGHADAVAALLRGGAAVNAVGSGGKTALMRAAYLGQAECARLLLEAGADGSLRATGGALEGKTALEVAEQMGKAEVAVLLGTTSKKLQGAATGKTLRKAAAEGRADAVAALLEGGAAVDAVGGNGFTALICAAAFGHAEC